MVEAHINLWAVLVAAVASMVIGAVWYMALAKPWQQESGVTEKQMKSSAKPYIVSFLAELLIAYMIAHVFFYVYTGGGGLAEGAMTGFYTWLGFAATVTAINYAYQMKSFKLFAIDAGYTLVFFVVSGAIIGAWK